MHMSVKRTEIRNFNTHHTIKPMVKHTHPDPFSEEWLCSAVRSLEPQSVFKMFCFYFLLHFMRVT